jgi:N6-L-threonylcarbamoyladenine synthase
MNNLLILAIDTSCDDTSVAVLRGNKILSSEVSSQVEIHAQWGGVVPDIARREHEKNIPIVYEKALKRAKVKIEDVDYIACTYGPGLAIDLEIGLNFAKDLAIENGLPFVPINHMEGHLLSGFLGSDPGLSLDQKKLHSDNILKPQGSYQGLSLFPAIGLLVSGKHTELVHVQQTGEYKKLGETLDDAVGEAFDKVARMLNLGYPGGPVITEFAKKGKSGEIVFPIPMKNSKDLNFSYSGLKTAALYKVKELREEGKPEKEWIYDFCRGFLDAVNESIKIKLDMAIEQYPEIKAIFVGGGVFNSEEMVRFIGNIARSYGLEYIYPKKEYRGDNAGMVGIVAYYKIQRKEYITDKNEIKEIDREPRLSL